MNSFAKTFNTTSLFMSYSMLMAVRTWCISMFSPVRICIKHCKRVVSWRIFQQIRILKNLPVKSSEVFFCD